MAECRLLWEDGTYALLESGLYLYLEQYTDCAYQANQGTRLRPPPKRLRNVFRPPRLAVPDYE